VDDTRRQRLWLLGSTALVIVLIVVAAIAIGGAGGGTSGTTTGTPVGIADARALFAGIPQRGTVLGDRRAPVTVTEYADLQCPYCGRSARDEWPKSVRRYVRGGRVKLDLRLLDFLGPDSTRGARLAAAAALQGKLWQFAYLVYRNQGEERSGWITDAYLRRVAAGAGLDVRRAFAQRSSPAVRVALAAAKGAAAAAGIEVTPTFLIVRAGRKPRRVRGAADLSGAVDDLLSAP
jgi:protein-disulfide isomerase